MCLNSIYKSKYYKLSYQNVIQGLFSRKISFELQDSNRELQEKFFSFHAKQTDF